VHNILINEALQLAQDLDLAIYPTYLNEKYASLRDYNKKIFTDEEIRTRAAQLQERDGGYGVGFCPKLSDVIVIDVDLHKGDACKFEDWLGDNELPPTLTVETKNKGKHFWFDTQHVPSDLTFKDQAGEGFDIKYNGNVILPPTAGYKIISPDLDIAPLPQWLVDKLTVDRWEPVEIDEKRVALARAARGNVEENKSIIAELERTPLPDGALTYDEWRNVCFGMHYTFVETLYEDAARAAFIKWSMSWETKDAERKDAAEMSAEAEWDRQPHTFAEALMKASAKGNPVTKRGVGWVINKIVGNERAEKVEKKVKEQVQGVSDFLRVGTDVVFDELESIEWVIDQSMPAGGLVSWAGPSGAGKTRYIALLLACLTTGSTEVMGLPPSEACNSLYVANEERATDIQRRVKAAMVANDLPQGDCAVYVRGKDAGRFSMTVMTPEGLVRNDELFDKLAQQIKDLDIGVVVFDPFVTLGSGGESDPADIDLINSFMTDLSVETGCVCGHVHHTPKDRASAPDAERGMDGAWRGHGSIYSALDMGDSIFPFIPTEISTGKEMKAKLRRMKELHASRVLPKYVVVDPVKVREGVEPQTRVYMLTEEAVNSAGQMIGVLVLVPDRHAVEQEIVAAVAGADMKALADETQLWAEQLLYFMAGEKYVRTSLKEVHEWMQKHIPTQWSTAQRLLATRDMGEKFLLRMEKPVHFQGNLVSARMVKSQLVLEVHDH